MLAGWLGVADLGAADPLVQVDDVPGLPRVLLIGDSISIGYTLPVREMLDGKANVHRPPTNCGPTTRGLAQIDAWIGEKPWDVIHFNWGLHDLKYVVEGEKIVAVDTAGAHQLVPIDAYEKNLATLVERLQETGAALIWRNTTPVPEGARGRVVGDSVRYNEAAARVMAAAGVPTHDLYAFAKENAAKIQRKADVHYTTDGSRQLAAEVVEAITAKLPATDAREAR